MGRGGEGKGDVGGKGGGDDGKGIEISETRAWIAEYQKLGERGGMVAIHECSSDSLEGRG